MMPALPLTGRNRAPETAALTKSRTLPTDGAVAKFLMTILQQLDMKSVNWQEVADDMGVSNGHAARMRYSRLKTQMGYSNLAERRTNSGVAPKKPRNKKAAIKTTVGDDVEVKGQFESDNQGTGGRLEATAGQFVKGESANGMAESEALGSPYPASNSEMIQERDLSFPVGPVIKQELSEGAFDLTESAEDDETPASNSDIVFSGHSIKKESDCMVED